MGTLPSPTSGPGAKPECLGLQSGQVTNTSGTVYKILRAWLFLLPPEVAHHFAFRALIIFSRVPVLRTLLGLQQGLDPKLAVRVMGIDFPSPLGLAAGFDKNAVGYNSLAQLGFGFVEVGTVTGQPQPGNPRPRLFRLKADSAIINRMGFNNDGAQVVAKRLSSPRHCVLGVNIGKTKIVDEANAVADYQKSTRLLAPSADYLVVNVSSPNTPGLRDLQATEKLRPLLTAVQTEIKALALPAKLPLLVKIAPDLADDDVDAVADLALELNLDGIIATNTTVSREGLQTQASEVHACGVGGLSGPVLGERSLQVLRRLRARVGERLCLISVGGISNAEDAVERLEAGADLLQTYTSFIYGGPGLVANIHQGILSAMERRRVCTLAALRSPEKNSSSPSSPNVPSV